MGRSSPPRKRGSRVNAPPDQRVVRTTDEGFFGCPWIPAFAGMTMRDQHIGQSQFIPGRPLRRREGVVSKYAESQCSRSFDGFERPAPAPTILFARLAAHKLHFHQPLGAGNGMETGKRYDELALRRVAW